MIDILYQDEHFVAVHKQSGLVVHPTKLVVALESWVGRSKRLPVNGVEKGEVLSNFSMRSAGKSYLGVGCRVATAINSTRYCAYGKEFERSGGSAARVRARTPFPQTC